MTFGDGSNGVPYILASGGGIVAVGGAIDVPTMSEWALVLMAGLLAALAVWYLRRRMR